MRFLNRPSGSRNVRAAFTLLESLVVMLTTVLLATVVYAGLFGNIKSGPQLPEHQGQPKGRKMMPPLAPDPKPNGNLEPAPEVANPGSGDKVDPETANPERTES